MQDELEQLKKAPSKSAYQTPPPKVAAPSPARCDAQHPPPLPPAPKGLEPADAQPPPASEGAKLGRLRRLCDRKPSGKLAVPESVHLRWKQGDKHEREAMVEEFERANWSKELWITDSEKSYLNHM